MTELVELINVMAGQRRKVNAKNKERIKALKAVGYAEAVKLEPKPEPKPKLKPKKAEPKDDDVLSE